MEIGPENPTRISMLPSTAHQTYVVRLASTPDEARLFRTVGHLVNELYPDGREKLIAKLFANMALGDHSFVVKVDDDIGAYAAETLKTGGRLKLSTIWVRDDLRRRGIGRALTEFLVDRWLRLKIAEVYVTVRVGRDEELLALLSQYGFWRGARANNRYGPGRDEVVLQWTPESYKLRLVGTARSLNG